jgi:hypothetical protein
MPSPEWLKFNRERMTEVRVALDDCILLNPKQVNSSTNHQISLLVTLREGQQARDLLKSAAWLQILTKSFLFKDHVAVGRRPVLHLRIRI